MTSTPHDALFKSTFSDRDNAIAELRAVLPSALVARLDFSTLEVESGGYVDPELGARFSDIVYRVTVGDTLVRIYVLFEHQSRPDADMAFRLLRYMVRLWEHVDKTEPAARRPPIVPIVLTHGDRSWKVSRSFLDTLALGDDASVRAAIEPYVPRFEYLLDDSRSSRIGRSRSAPPPRGCGWCCSSCAMDAAVACLGCSPHTASCSRPCSAAGPSRCSRSS